MITAKIAVMLKNGILDPQGKTVHHALENLGFGQIENVRMGKIISERLATPDDPIFSSGVTFHSIRRSKKSLKDSQKNTDGTTPAPSPSKPKKPPR